MDIKVKGLTFELMRRALAQAREGRLFILGKMLETISGAREDISPFAPRVERVKIGQDKIGALIGPGGKVIRKLQEETKTQIEIDDQAGTATIAGGPGSNMESAIAQVRALTEEVEIGKIYRGRVTSVKDFGAFVEILPGKDGLCHISELSDEYVRTVSDVCKVGDPMPVKVIAVDEQDRVKLSRKQALRDQAAGNGDGQS